MKEYIEYLLKFIMHSFLFIMPLALLICLLIAITNISALLFGNLLLFYIFGIYYFHKATGHVIASKQDYGRKDTADNIRILRSMLFAVVSSLTILWLMYPGESGNFIQEIPYGTTSYFSLYDGDDMHISDTTYSCDSAPYCTEMNSCQEAEFYYFDCGLDRLDKDNDGIPCESICN